MSAEGMMRYDAVIVGAGLAGLMAARVLREAGKRVGVLEARDRVGGRTLSQRLGSDTIDLGAQWVGPDQQRIMKLSRELGVATFAQHHQGKKVLEEQGRIGSYKQFYNAFSPLSQFALYRMVRKFDRWAAEIPADAPHNAPRAHEWDSITVASWRDQNVRMAGAQMFLEGATKAVFGAELNEISFLYFLHYLQTGKGLEKLTEIHGGAQQDRFAGGAQQVSEKLAAPLGEDLVLNAPVRAIVQDETGVTVRYDGGEVRAAQVIVAVPPTLAGRIHYSPVLPAARDRVTQRMPMGCIIKCVAAYERPFWRDKGLSGEGFSAVGPISVTFDDSPEDASQGALVGFLAGKEAREWSGADPETRRDAVLGSFARLFGEEARTPIAYVDRDWSEEEWSRGCYVGIMAPGALTACGDALRAHCGRIHWAGTETATEHIGYMDGALQSGERAAREVLSL